MRTIAFHIVFFLVLLRVSSLKDYPLSSPGLKLCISASNFIFLCVDIYIYLYLYINIYLVINRIYLSTSSFPVLHVYYEQ